MKILLKQKSELFALLLAVLVCALLFCFPSKTLFLGYLTAFLFWLGLSIGALEMLFVWRLTGGRWGAAIQRPLEAAIANTPMLAVLALPIVINSSAAYPWRHGVPPNQYLNFGFFIGRTIFYCVTWILLQRGYVKRAREGRSLEAFSALGAVLLLFTCTFSAIDWVMSLTPDWSSTAFGVFFLLGNAFSALAFGVLAGKRYLNGISVRWDLAKVVFTALLLLLYLYYSQYLIYWLGNIPNEISWYTNRNRHGWQIVSLSLVFGYMALPSAFLLLSGWYGRFLIAAAVVILFLRCVELWWLVVPGQVPACPALLTAIAFGAPIGIIWRAKYRGARAIQDTNHA